MELNITSHELSELIGDIYDAALNANWNNAFEKLLTYTGSNKVFFFLQKLDESAPFILEINATFKYPQQALLEYQANPFEDPFYLVTKSMTEGESKYLNDEIDICSYKNSDYYNNILLPMKTYFVLAGVLCRDGSYESAFAINRAENELPYTQQDKNLITIITPHLSKAMHIYKELRLYKNYANISKSILDQQEHAVLVCNEHGDIIINNDYALDKLIATSPVCIANDKLKLTDRKRQKQLNYYISQCSQLAYLEIGTQETIIIENAQHENILITVSPLKNYNTFNDIDVSCCLVTVHFQKQLNWQKLTAEFALTPKELRLLKAIYAKKKLKELTDMFNVSYNTLRTHLQNIFQKTGVNSQTELMVKISLFK